MAKESTNKKMLVEGFAHLRDLRDFVNANHIKKEDILSIDKDKDGINYMLVYFVEE